MRMLLVSLLYMIIASCSAPLKPIIKVGIDPAFYTVEVLGREPAIKAFFSELLSTSSEKSGVTYTLENANWDTLFEGLNDGKYQIIITGTAPYNFNENSYAFSPLLLQTGPVLITQKNAPYKKMQVLQGKELGILSTTSAVLADKNPGILLRTYESIPKMLTDLSLGNIDAALAPHLPALGYCKDLFAGTLQIASSPLNDAGLRCITLKKEEKAVLFPLNNAVETLKQEGIYNQLLKRWNLS